MPSIISWEDIFPFIGWNLWLNRNNNNSNNINNTSHPLLASSVVKQALEYKLFTDKKNNTLKRIPLCISWHATPKGWYKINADGTFRSGKPISGIGGLIRNADSNWTFGFIKSIHADSPIYAELQAIHQGLTIAVEYIFTPLEVETDSTDVIYYLQKGYMTYNNIIFYYRWLMAKMGQVVLKHNCKEGNEAAHQMERECSK